MAVSGSSRVNFAFDDTSLISTSFQDDYLFLYRAIESLVSSMNLTETVDCSPYGSQVNVNNSHLLNTNGHVVKINISGDATIKSDSLS